jgi:N-carbamoyl-L-amino-acid hydrolase
VAALKAAGHTPACNIAVMAVRAEESPWFSTSYFGSRAALGALPDGILDTLRRSDTGRTLADHVAACGGDPDALRHGPARLTRDNVRAFLEVHIEQGPVLETEDCPIGIVTGVRGNFRFPRGRIHGAYQHCGGTPRTHRQDAVVAAAEFVAALQALWDAWEAGGRDMAFTVGRLFTDPDHHAMTKVPGLVEFSLDVRSIDPDLLEDLERRVHALMEEVAERRGVRFDVGPTTHAAVGKVDPGIREGLARGADALGIRAHHMPSGAAHDAAAFAEAGIPSGMIFIRNTNGSHNPQESMEIDDFREATRLLAWWLAETTA